jgi:hypothetical protein
VCEGGISSDQAMCGRVRLGRRDTLDENLDLIIEVQASVFTENVLDVREHLERNGEFGLDVTIVGPFLRSNSEGVVCAEFGDKKPRNDEKCALFCLPSIR